MPSRKPELVDVTDVAKLIGRDRATIFRWFASGKLTRHYRHDFERGVRRAAVDMREIRERMPKLLDPTPDP